MRMINTIEANRDLEKAIGGKSGEVTELKRWHLLVEVTHERQSMRIPTLLDARKLFSKFQLKYKSTRH